MTWGKKSKAIRRAEQARRGELDFQRWWSTRVRTRAAFGHPEAQTAGWDYLGPLPWPEWVSPHALYVDFALWIGDNPVMSKMAFCLLAHRYLQGLVVDTKTAQLKISHFPPRTIKKPRRMWSLEIPLD